MAAAPLSNRSPRRRLRYATWSIAATVPVLLICAGVEPSLSEEPQRIVLGALTIASLLGVAGIALATIADRVDELVSTPGPRARDTWRNPPAWFAPTLLLGRFLKRESARQLSDRVRADVKDLRALQRRGSSWPTLLLAAWVRSVVALVSLVPEPVWSVITRGVAKK